MGRFENKVLFLVCLIFIQAFSSCGDFLEVEPPSTKIVSELVFANDAAATGAIAGVYLDLYGVSSFAQGKEVSIMNLTGLSADELHNDRDADQYFFEFERNDISASNTYVLSLWTSMYKSIYQVNAILEGLDRSNGISSLTRNQLEGEALFIRGFCYFYLVNCFGDVPLVTTTDYRLNANLKRSSKSEVYERIKSDLLAAENLLLPDYPTEGRVRPNKFTATAMLARVYLYTSDWQRAEERATNVIVQSTIYNLAPNLDIVFLANSSEAIWQLKPANEIRYANEGDFFGKFRPNVLDTMIIKSFEANDKRKMDWIKQITPTTYIPNKYKNTYSSSPTIEYSMVLRIAEQYLIRAEARAQQAGKLSLAIADVDMIRSRAGLTLIQSTNPSIVKEELLLVIDQERRLELMVEWGHRWFDLKRRNRTNEILSPWKLGWSPEDELYPIPEAELRKNANLQPQNDGY